MRVKDIVFTVSTGDFDFTIEIYPRNPITLCEISTENYGLMSYGLGVRKHGDPYDPETGCRMALKSALGRFEDMFDYVERKAIWEAYLALFPAPERESSLARRRDQVVAQLIERVLGRGAFPVRINLQDLRALNGQVRQLVRR